MSKITEILKLQEEELEKIKPPEYNKNNKGFDLSLQIHYMYSDFIQSWNAKIIEAVCEEMTGEIKEPNLQLLNSFGVIKLKGYNTRIQEEIEIAKKLKETKI